MNFFSQFSGTLGALKLALNFLLAYWWVYMPFVLFFGCIELYKTYTRTRYLMSLKWILLEIKPPPDVQKSPKIAENIFAGLHGIYGSGTGGKEMFFEGKVPDWFSFEIVGDEGEMRFYIRTLEKYRNMVEVVIFAQYPDAEISLADDYATRLPKYLPNDEYDLFACELVFSKEDAYPIKTWPSFEEEGGKDEFVRSDPLSPLAEIMSALGPGEHIWLQLVARPTGGDWTKDAQKTVDKILGKEPSAPARGGIARTFDVVDSLFSTTPAAPVEKREKPEPSPSKLTPGQKFVLEQIENKLSKLAFKAGYRFAYIGRKDSFNPARIPTVIGMFKQMYSNNLNSFKPNKEAISKDSGWFPWLFPSDKGFFAEPRTFSKKRILYKKYREREFVKKHVILNTEELATLYHLPGINVKAPAFPRVEAKKGQPPVGLPTK